MAEKKQKREKKPPTPKTMKPWDIPPLPTRGDSRDDATYAAVGRALSSWEKLEFRLANLFSIYVNAKSYDIQPALRAYGSVLTFRGRADMLGAAVAAYFMNYPNDVLQKQTKELLDEMRLYSPRRNEIAHGVVRSDRSLRATREGRSFALFPAWYATSKHKLPTDSSQRKTIGLAPTYIYTSVEIAKFTEAFEELRTRFERLWQTTATFDMTERYRRGVEHTE